jgi:hypothetical protein
VIPGAPDVVASQVPGADANRIAEPLKSAHLDPWWIGQPVDMHVCVSMSPHGESCAVRGPRKELPRVVWENITFGDWKDSRVADWNVSLPKARGPTCISALYAEPMQSPSCTMRRCGWTRSSSRLALALTLGTRLSTANGLSIPARVRVHLSHDKSKGSQSARSAHAILP